MERRNAVRYRLRVPAVFRWENEGVSSQNEGLTRDISVKGAYLLSNGCPPLRCDVKVEIIVSALAGNPTAWLRGAMQVLRIEDQSGGGHGFSLAGTPFALCSEQGEVEVWNSFFGSLVKR